MDRELEKLLSVCLNAFMSSNIRRAIDIRNIYYQEDKVHKDDLKEDTAEVMDVKFVTNDDFEIGI